VRGENHLRMNSDLISIIKEEEFYPWPILVQIQILLNCTCFFRSTRFLNPYNDLPYLSSWHAYFCSYITYRSCKHLDGKHTVFGRVVGGLDTLSAMEKVEVDNKDNPIEDIVILDAQVFVDPFEEVDAILAEERARVIAEAAEQKRLQADKNKKAEPEKLKAYGSGVGKYINFKRK